MWFICSWYDVSYWFSATACFCDFIHGISMALMWSFIVEWYANSEHLSAISWANCSIGVPIGAGISVVEYV